MRLLVVPAAGLGSRLGASVPKVLAPVNGQSMLSLLLDLYRSWIQGLVVITHPSFTSHVTAHLEQLLQNASVRWSVAEQQSPTGMLDAIIEARPLISTNDPSTIWITWCDQVGVLPATIERLAGADSGSALTVPTIWRANPYIHFDRDREGRIVRVLHRREGDALPERGESDIGLFALSREAYLDYLPRYARETERGQQTRERNFLPFIPWLAVRAPVRTFPASDEREAIGINSPEDLRRVEAWLRSAQHANETRSSAS
jgi:bifunctional N-acetylglucosamine-1-phosphate-uridyltransferase/glucosamine-1-phosphate-acetyltransferase GlmU-like protein